MKNTLLVCTMLFVAGILGCQVMAGECWPVSEDGQGAGVGGGPFVPGSGGFGSVPPEPQAAEGPPPPECNRVNDGPCIERCHGNYEDAAVSCAKITDEAERKLCDSTAHSRYTSCRASCTQKEDDPIEKCKQVCDRQYEECCKPCKTKKCYSDCMDIYKKCLRACEE